MRLSNIQAERMFLEGREWVCAEYVRDIEDRLVRKQRTDASHRQQFAEIRELWENLPEGQHNQPWARSAEHFRKHALIETGWCDTKTIAFEDQAHAVKAAPFIADLARKAHGYAITIVRGPLVLCSTPHSQSYKAMGKENFQQSKSDVLEWCKRKVGV